MALLKTAWANLQDGLGNRFSWSHVKAIFYNYAEHKLLSTKLDEMDALIDAKIAKAMMSSVQVNDKSKVPTSALAYSMSQEISQNEQNIAQLNSKMDSKADKSDIADKNQYVLSYNADDWKLLFAVEKGIFYVRVVNINTGDLVYGGKITLTAFE